MVALAITYTLGITFNYFTTKNVVFRVRSNRRPLIFIGIYGCLYGLNCAALMSLESLGLDSITAQAILIIPMASLTYLALRRVFVNGQIQYEKR